jgi:alkaline phosphatase
MRYRFLWLILVAMLLLAVLPAVAAPQADSVILFIGDGMGSGQIELTRRTNGGAPLVMQQLPYSGMVTTTSLGGHVTDSAAAGTALATGYKTKNGILGLSPDGKRLETILERCQKEQKSAGLITTDALWGATPAAFVSHVTSRDKYAEITLQTSNSGAQVLMGFGKDDFLPDAAGGARKDGKDLIATMKRANYEFVYTVAEFAKAKGSKLVGLFQEGKTAPRLADMVKAALPRLSANPKGFFLMVEGARIDWASHLSNPAGVMKELTNLDAAVAFAKDFARQHGRILVLVTADHETGGLVVEPAKQAKEAPSVKWTNPGGHTANPVHVFAFGPGAERFTGEMDNTQIPVKIAEILGCGKFPQ